MVMVLAVNSDNCILQKKHPDSARIIHSQQSKGIKITKGPRNDSWR